MTTKDEAARLRAGYLRALREERDGYERAGKSDRVAGVDAEIARVEDRPIGRSETPTEPTPKPRARRA